MKKNSCVVFWVRKKKDGRFILLRTLYCYAAKCRSALKIDLSCHLIIPAIVYLDSFLLRFRKKIEFLKSRLDLKIRMMFVLVL